VVRVLDRVRGPQQVVAAPEAGRGTAFIISRESTEGGTQGPVLFGASVASWQAFGTVSPASATIPAGATLAVHVHGMTPTTPGDTAASLVVSPAGQPAQSVPMTFRAMVPTGPTSFGGVLTGGVDANVEVGLGMLLVVAAAVMLLTAFKVLTKLNTNV